jgi:glycosyltransferase involved in cell wall biosynthesis
VDSIQFIARFNRGGTAEWLKVLLPGLTSSGCGTKLYAGHVQDDEVEDLSFVQLGGVRIDSLGKGINFSRDFESFLKFRKILKDTRPSVMNTHTAKAGVIGRLAALSLLDRPAIVHTYHGHLLYGYFSGFKLKILVTIEKFLALRSDILVAAGDQVCKELLDYGIGKEDQYVIASPGVIKPKANSNIDFRIKLGISPDKVVVGWLGRLTKIKRPDRVLRLAMEFPDIIFLIGGDGELFDELCATKTKNVHLLGWTEPANIWACSDIALLTSDNEAQPIALIEAGLFGIPAIAENVGSVCEVIQDRTTGFLTKSHEDRAKYLGILINDSDLRREIGQNAMGVCMKKFSLEQFVSSHLSAYEKALARRKKRR